MKLYDLPQRREEGNRPKIYKALLDYPLGWIEFDHMDGMYSYCVAYDHAGNKISVCHLHCGTVLEPYEDGYIIVPDLPESEPD